MSSSTKFFGFHSTGSQSIIAGDSWGDIFGPLYLVRKVNYRFETHFHPYIDDFIETLNEGGLNAMMSPGFLSARKAVLSPDLYKIGPDVIPTTVSKAFPELDVDTSDSGAYAVYNWELFFHIPLLVAVHLSINQRFEEAQRWFHRIFDPTSTDKEAGPKRFWKFLRFREETSSEFIDQLLRELAEGKDSVLKARMETAIRKWREAPFQPHAVARGRYLSYQLNVLMKYLDNLLAWGDSLFRQDTVETLNEATQIYVMAANLLGPRPQRVPPRFKAQVMTYGQLQKQQKDGFDKFGNAMVELENEFPFNAFSSGTTGPADSGSQTAFGVGSTLYFCVPQNEKLLGYWDKVSDRLFKLRHCMNIEGMVRQLALFDPPIDPGVLVRAAAAGFDVASIVNNVNQPVSTVRGPLLLQKAIELCSEVKALGSALLAAIEKGDSEHIALLRQQGELHSLDLARDVRFLQWKEAESATESLLKSRATVWERYRHYKRILGTSESDISSLKAIDLTRAELTEENFVSLYAELVDKYTKILQREDYRKETTVGGLMEFAGNNAIANLGGQLGATLPLNKNESAELNIYLPTAETLRTAAFMANIATPILSVIPQFAIHATPVGVGGRVDFGGVELSAAARAVAQQLELVSGAFRSSADTASRLGSYYRRAEDYVLQANLASSELEQYGRQIISALLREQIVKREYENHKDLRDQSEAQEIFLRSKFSNEELYAWMKAEISKTYFDCYKFAFDVAKRAEQTLKFEVMRSEFDALNIIRYGYWDNARKGLLAGDTLYLDLRRLEVAYLENAKRDYEITQHISLARLDPIALLGLKATGKCVVDVPEWLFDMMSPGQYMRRIKSVSLSIPCVTGPYQGVHCKLSLLRSSIRISDGLLGGGYRKSEEDPRFRDFTGSIQSVVTSTSQNDAGLFEANLRDERYLPFEGAGVISSWKIELPNEVPQFDFDSISDVVLHVRYTARDASGLRVAASDRVKEVIRDEGNLVQLSCLNTDFAGAWQKFRGAAADADRLLSIKVAQEFFPYWTKRLGMDDALVAKFAEIDFATNRLSVSPPKDLIGTPDAGWTLEIKTPDGSGVFSYLKKNIDSRVYMMLAYRAAP